jgi:hypothetical protein
MPGDVAASITAGEGTKLIRDAIREIDDADECHGSPSALERRVDKLENANDSSAAAGRRERFKPAIGKTEQKL